MSEAGGEMAVGYLSETYTDSFRDVAEPVFLPQSGGWLLERVIRDTSHCDAMGCYPLFLCSNWSKLSEDLEQANRGWVSVTSIVDPFGDYTEELLRDTYKDVVRPFKEHFVADLSTPVEKLANKHHRYYARRAFRDVHTEVLKHPVEFLDDWVRLYNVLVERHNIQDVRAFTREAFRKQLETPNMIVIRAVRNGESVGAHIWVRHGDVVTSHLAAYSPKGYEVNVAYAIYWDSIEYFASQGARWLNLGAGSGTTQQHDDGLTRFKRGWTSTTRTAYLCGRILDWEGYRALTGRDEIDPEQYFPFYRKGEFGASKTSGEST